ncbi:substrate-binding domain-containing protein [Kribbella sp. NPDC051586]|uniref:substrate-binding domain-containing protein n=1 Tax=Kribbella sp. NPDC051586 TaxID=3364118 RepID=UPI0037AED401
MRRTVPVILLAATLACTTACTKTKSGGDSSDSGGPIKIGLVTKTDTNPYFVKLRESAKAHARDKGAELIAVAGKFDGDNEGQVAAIENLVQQGVKGIMITPSNSTGILGALKQAKEKGVLVIALDTETDPKDAVDATYATNNTTAGELQGKYIKATLGSTPPKLLMMDGTPGGTVDEQRHRGFLQGMGLKDGDPAILGAAPTNGDQNKAQAAMENLLQRDSTVNAVYTLNEPAARGAVAALSAKGLAGKVAVGSIDGGCQGVADVKAGKYLATVMQFPKKMAEQGVDAVVDFAKNGKKPTGFVDTGAQLITDKPVAGMDAKDTAWGAQNCWG